MSETMSIDHLAALDEFADDPEAYEKLVAADARRWEGVARDLRMARKAQEAYEAAIEVVKASGVELLESRAYDRPTLARSNEKPEGAEAAYVVSYQWNGSAEIVWYGAVHADGGPDPEAEAARAAAQAKREELESRKLARLEFIEARLDFASDLKRLADDAWHNKGAFKRPANSYGPGFVANHAVLDGTPFEDAHGLATRMIAAVLVTVEGRASRALTNDWELDNIGKGAIAYFDALSSLGYEPSEVEAAAISALRDAMKPKRKKKEQS